MAPSTANLKDVEVQISETTAHIQALKLQLRRAEIKLLRLRKEEAAILETTKGHRSVLSTVRNLPDDVLREILIACVEDKRPPILSYYEKPLPCVLAQISSGIRRIALSTSILWASMDVQFDPFHDDGLGERAYSNLAHRVVEWFERARGLPLTMFIDCSSSYPYYSSGRYVVESNPSNILFDTLLSYSDRWKTIQVSSSCEEFSILIDDIISLTAADVPLLQSVTLRLDCIFQRAALPSTVFLKIPTLRHVSLETDYVRWFPVNWATLTTLSLDARSGTYLYCYSKNEIAKILQKTKYLVSCDIGVGRAQPHEMLNRHEISLPFLETLRVAEISSVLEPPTSPEAPSLLDILSTPILAELHICEHFLELSLLNFLKRSPNISKLELPYLKADESLAITTKLLRHCPSLTTLLLPHYRNPIYTPSIRDVNTFMRRFVEVEGDASVICPGLQYFKFTGLINFSLETFRLFLEGKQRSFTMPNIAPWRTVIIDLQGVQELEAQQDMLELISQKNSEGLDVNAFLNHEDRSSD